MSFSELVDKVQKKPPSPWVLLDATNYNLFQPVETQEVM
jgi:hypothetical protein